MTTCILTARKGLKQYKLVHFWKRKLLSLCKNRKCTNLHMCGENDDDWLLIDFPQPYLLVGYQAWIAWTLRYRNVSSTVPPFSINVGSLASSCSLRQFIPQHYISSTMKTMRYTQYAIMSSLFSFSSCSSEWCSVIYNPYNTLSILHGLPARCGEDPFYS